MAVTHTGIVAVWGVAGSTLSARLTPGGSDTAVTGIVFSSSDASSDAKEVMHTNGETGGTIGVTFFDTGKTVSVECYLTSTISKTAAINAKALLPTKGSKVIITGVTGDTSDAIVGTYVCMSAAQRRNNSDKLVVTLTLQAWDELTGYNPIAG